MKITAIINDKTLIKDGYGLIINEDAFWSTYSNINAFQIDTENTSEVELNDGTLREPTQDEIDTLSNKFDTVKTEVETQRINDENAYLNSWERIRNLRDFWLSKTDWTVLPDSPLSDTEKTNYETYRTNLRNIPSTYSSEQPRDIEFDSNGNVSLNSTTIITKP
jgi:hypothetical protein